ADGTFDLRAGSGPYDVLIVPIASTKAPAHIGGWKSFQPNLTLPDGEPISGTVIGPDNAGVAGASVLLTIGGVPSTIGITDTAGAGSVAGHGGGGGRVDVSVLPPDAAGLPRLALHGAVIDVGQPIAVHYAPGLASDDVHTALVSVAGVAAAGARVTFTGTMP